MTFLACVTVVVAASSSEVIHNQLILMYYFGIMSLLSINFIFLHFHYDAYWDVILVDLNITLFFCDDNVIRL